MNLFLHTLRTIFGIFHALLMLQALLVDWFKLQCITAKPLKIRTHRSESTSPG
jgi:hypothetical protein